MELSNPLTRFIYVVNPIAGGKDKEETLALLQDFSLRKNLQYQVIKTTGVNDSEVLRNSIIDFKPHVVVAIGGDGTVNLVAKELVNKDLILGIIPLGSGNGLSKDLGIPQNDITAALDLLCQSNITKIDTLEVNGNFFIHLADLGFNAHIVKLFNQGKNRGLFSYIKLTIREFLSYKTFRYKIRTDHKIVKGRAFMITIANSNQFGSNITINPEGKMDDGVFEIIIIKRFPRRKIPGLFFSLLTKRIKYSPYCIIIPSRSAVIHTKKRKTLQFDGEIANEVRRVEVNIFTKSLNILALPLNN
jgi:diacylglycerol kinase (ATP)